LSLSRLNSPGREFGEIPQNSAKFREIPSNSTQILAQLIENQGNDQKGTMEFFPKKTSPVNIPPINLFAFASLCSSGGDELTRALIPSLALSVSATSHSISASNPHKPHAISHISPNFAFTDFRWLSLPFALPSPDS
jgi:hypothetical protein